MISNLKKKPVKAMVVEQEIYQVYANEDGNEGRGRDIVIGIFLDKDMAENYAIGKDVMGLNARVVSCMALCVTMPDNTVYLLGTPVDTKVFVPEMDEEKIRKIEKDYEDLQKWKINRANKINHGFDKK